MGVAGVENKAACYNVGSGIVGLKSLVRNIGAMAMAHVEVTINAVAAVESLMDFSMEAAINDNCGKMKTKEQS